MRKLYVIASILLLLILGCDSSNQVSLPTKPPLLNTSVNHENSVITCAMYKLLLPGMTIERVEELLGRKSDRYMQYLKGDQFYETYTWINPNQSRIFVNFINGILVKKGEYLLCTPSDYDLKTKKSKNGQS